MNLNESIVVHNTMPRSSKTGKGGTGPLSRADGKTYCLDTGRTNAIEFKGVLNPNQLKKFDPTINSDKSNCLTLAQGRAGSSSEYMDSVSKIANITSNIRRLTPLECSRLQTISDHYFYKDGKQIVSDSAMYKAIGNCWTIDVITHLLSYLKL